MPGQCNSRRRLLVASEKDFLYAERERVLLSANCGGQMAGAKADDILIA